MDSRSERHYGKPIIRSHRTHILILCSHGHLYESYSRSEWPPYLLDYKLARLEAQGCDGTRAQGR